MPHPLFFRSGFRFPPRRAILAAAALVFLVPLFSGPAWCADPPTQTGETHEDHPPTPVVTDCGPEAQTWPPRPAGFTRECMDMHLPEAQRFKDAWNSVLARHDPETVYGAKISLLTGPVLQQWRNLAKAMPTLAQPQQLQYINGFYNNWPSAKDIDNYGQDEYWATPEEFLDKGGDCEDFAIVKYFALRYFGWPRENLWLLLVENNKDKEKHAVLMARAKGQIFVLDNLSRPGYLLIPEESYVKLFTPLYAINERGLWMFSRTSGANTGGQGKAAPAKGGANRAKSGQER